MKNPTGRSFVFSDEYTENNARSYSTVHDARLELFFKAVRGLQVDNLINMSERSWKESPLDTLKLGFQMRDCRQGKGERGLFIQFMKWLSKYSPENLIINLDQIHKYGRWLDLIEITVDNPNN